MRNIKDYTIVVLTIYLLSISSARAEKTISPMELEALKEMMQEVILKNRDLTKRVHELETEMARLKSSKQNPGMEATEPALEVVKRTTTPHKPEIPEIKAITIEQEKLEQRMKELETAQTAQESTTSWIIRDSISSLGSNINEFVTLGGTLEVSTGWGENFTDPSESELRLETAELDLEIKVNDWMMGGLIIEYDDGKDTVFRSTEGNEISIDKVNIDTAFFTIGNTQKFPPFLKLGRIILPFGISTGDPVADVLTLENPLTIDVFESRKTAIGFGFGFPTPALTPTTPPVEVPSVKPMIINPFFDSLSKHLGYKPPPSLPPLPNFITPPLASPLFNAGIYFYDGNTSGWKPSDHFNATLGFQTKGNCGRRYEELTDSFLCPWSIDIDIDFNSSVFDSNFLESEYKHYLDQIGTVPGLAASAKGNLGPISLVFEWNAALDQATFINDFGPVSLKPQAWQVSLGYQFDWNPWVEAIGSQGTYIALGYSESRDLAGITQLISGEPNRVGAVPKRRYLISVGEWILEGFRFAVEYSYDEDYSKNEGGTGNAASRVFTTFTYEW